MEKLNECHSYIVMTFDNNLHELSRAREENIYRTLAPHLLKDMK